MDPANPFTAWAAGLFEGEGSIDFKTGDRTGISLVVNMTDFDVLEKFRAVTGCGNVREVKAPSIVRPHWKTCWSWKISRADECKRLLEAWLPYLGERRGSRAREALQVLADKEAGRWRVCHCGKPFRAEHKNHWACSADCRESWQQAVE